MPFTVSHVAAVLPGHRLLARAQVFSAAVIGSMVPDFGLLLPEKLARWQTHSIPALLHFCLPVGLAAYVLMLLLIKPAVLQIVPDGPYLRLRDADFTALLRTARGWLYVALAILLGAVTHLIWDGFTHENARGVLMFPVLDDYGPQVDGHTLQFYAWLQYASSVLGLMAVIGALLLWLRHAPTPARRPLRCLQDSERRAWTGLYILLPLLAMAGAMWLIRSPPLALLPVGRKLGIVAIAGLRGSAVSLLLVSVLLRVRLRFVRQVPRS
jgi:hypothetical protein